VLGSTTNESKTPGTEVQRGSPHPSPWTWSLARVKRLTNFPVEDGAETRVALSMNQVGVPASEAATRCGVENRAPVVITRSGLIFRWTRIASGSRDAARSRRPEPTGGTHTTSSPASTASVCALRLVTHTALLTSMSRTRTRIFSSSR